MKKLLLVLATMAICLALLPVGRSSIRADGPTPVSVPAEDGDTSIQADGPTPVSVPAEENANFVDIVAVPQLATVPEGKLEVSDGVVEIPQSVRAPAEEVAVNTPQTDPRGVSPPLPGDFKASAGSVTVMAVWTTDESGNNKSTFNCGNSIRYYGYVNNSTGGMVTAYFQWSVNGPCGPIASWSGYLNAGAGNWWWCLPATIPSNTCAGTYTYELNVTYGGSTSSKSITFTVNCAGGVTVTSVWTTDGSGNNKSTFNCGDSIRYHGYVNNSTGGTVTAYFQWSVNGPCGPIVSWSVYSNADAGNWWWCLPATIPSNACAGMYTYQLSVTYGGSTSSKSITFTVNCAGGVTVTSVWTTDGTDGSRNNKSTFNCGDSIGYYGNIYNNTGSFKTAYFSWSVTGPCGSIASWSGNLTTSNGNVWWYLLTTILSNACPGTYTYQLSVTYAGSTSSKSTTFTVNCGSTDMSFEQTVGGGLSNSFPRANYSFAASAGQSASIRMFAYSGSLNTYIKLYTPDGQLFAEDDDGAGVGYNSFLVRQLPQSGTYRLEATRYGSTSGDYRLRLEAGLEADLGDLDRNCVVDEADRQRMVNSIGTSDQNADLNLDGVVNSIDYSILLGRIGRSCNWIEGTLELLDLEGGCWVVTDNLGVHYELYGPLAGEINRPENIGKRIRIAGRVRTDLVLSCMVGPIFEVFAYEF